MAYFNSYSFAAGTQSRLATPIIQPRRHDDAKAQLLDDPRLDLYQRRHHRRPDLHRRRTSYTTLATFHRRTGGTAAGVWVNHLVDLTAVHRPDHASASASWPRAPTATTWPSTTCPSANYNLVNDTQNCTHGPPGPRLLGRRLDVRRHELQQPVRLDELDSVSGRGRRRATSSSTSRNTGNDAAYNVVGTLTCPSCPGGRPDLQEHRELRDHPLRHELRLSPRRQRLPGSPCLRA